MTLALPAGPGGALLIGLTLVAWLLAAGRLLLHRRAGLPGVGWSLAMAVAAAGALVVHLTLVDALDLVMQSRAVMRRAVLRAALEEALAPTQTVGLLATLALLPHLPLAALERPVRGRWAARVFGVMASLVLLLALERTWTLHALLVELAPVLEQLDAPPERVFRLIDEEARGPLEQAAALDLGALALAGFGGVTGLLAGILGLIRDAKVASE